nr:VanZ family protein [Flavobacterium amniphilum]
MWTLLVFYLSFKTPSEIPKFDFFLADKLIHFSFYFGFVFLWYHYMCFKKRVNWKDKLNLVIIAVFIGVLIEFCQGYFTTNRQADVFDALANAIGSLCGIATASLLFKKIF